MQRNTLDIVSYTLKLWVWCFFLLFATGFGALQVMSLRPRFQAAAQQAQREGGSEDDIEAVKGMARLFAELGESYVGLLAQGVASWAAHLIMLRQPDCIIHCACHLTVCKPTEAWPAHADQFLTKVSLLSIITVLTTSAALPTPGKGFAQHVRVSERNMLYELHLRQSNVDGLCVRVWVCSLS